VNEISPEESEDIADEETDLEPEDDEGKQWLSIIPATILCKNKKNIEII